MSDPKYNINAPNSNIGIIGDNATVQHIYLQSVDYQKLIKEIEGKKKYLKRIPEDEPQERLEASQDLKELEEQLQQFKENVFKLYETFTKIEINTERLRQAKYHFDQGEFREADAILKAEDMAKDLDQLITKDQQLDREKAQVKQDREHIANEFLIKARLWTTFYDKPDRLEQTCQYFEESLRANRTADNLFEYALFLKEHYKFKQAKPLYQEALQIYRALAQDNPSAFLPDVATTLNNLAVLHRAQNELALALSEYQEALQIYRALAQDNPSTFLPYVAMTLLSLSIFYLQSQPDKDKSITLAQETIAIALQFPDLPIVQNYAATATKVLQAHELNTNTQH